jgi:hypothetical protein
MALAWTEHAKTKPLGAVMPSWRDGNEFVRATLTISRAIASGTKVISSMPQRWRVSTNPRLQRPRILSDERR